MSEPDKTLTIVKTLTNNLRRIAALPQRQHPERRFRELAQAPGEKASAYRKRALEVLGGWWGYSGATVRSMEDGYKHGERSPRFHADLQRYAAVRFDDAGALIPESLGKGPEPYEYLSSLTSRKSGNGGSRPARSRARA